MATHSSILAWGIPRTEDPGRLQFMGSQKGQTQLSDQTTTMTTTIFKRQPGQYFSVLRPLTGTGLRHPFELLETRSSLSRERSPFPDNSCWASLPVSCQRLPLSTCREEKCHSLAIVPSPLEMPRVSLISTGSSRGGFYREAEAGLKASIKESWGVMWATKGISVTHGWLCPWEKKEVYLYNVCINKAEYLDLTISAAVMFWLHTLLGKFRLGRNRKPKIQLIVAKSSHKNVRLGRNNELVRKCLVAKKKMLIC